MGLLDLPKNLLGRAVSKASVFSAVSGFATERILSGNRKRWQQAKARNMEALLEQVSAYDIGRGAGKLLAGWLRYALPEFSLPHAETNLQRLLSDMDQADSLPEEKALSRFIVSKALFLQEGFRLSHCRYEAYQSEALALLRKNPQHKKLSRNDVFLGQPFAPEDVIGATHRMLLMLDDGRLANYIHAQCQSRRLRNDTDYMARLIALTLGCEDEALAPAISRWFDAYCDFKIEETRQQEGLINTSISTATGGLPANVGLDLLGRVGKAVFTRKP